ncbi:hypothetical protein LCGC14_2419550 [marine sediment metagenome]|uniref:Uncharacterized protein n=1 Tax=marine sediment metagenome TaxID=412755 RepID=A0A0F9BQ26_9ZZZZ
MGTEKTLERKMNFMRTLLKRKDLKDKQAILKEFCQIQVCRIETAREIYNVVK